MKQRRKPLIAIIAIVLVGGAGLLTFDYFTASRSTPNVPQRTIFVAARPINAREAITNADVAMTTRPATYVDPNSISSASQMRDEVALSDIPAGAVLTTSNVGKESQLISAVRLAPGMRAMSIGVDEVKDVSGLLQPGDHVDVFAVTPRTTDAQPEAFAILRNITVLSVGGQVTVAAAQAGSPPAQWRSVTLAVRPDQAKVLAVADLNASLRLALRPPGEPSRNETVDAFSLAPTRIAAAPAPVAAPMPAPPVAAPAPVAAPVSPMAKEAPPAPVHHDGDVEYILGDRVSQTGN